MFLCFSFILLSWTISKSEHGLRYILPYTFKKSIKCLAFILHPTIDTKRMNRESSRTVYLISVIEMWKWDGKIRGDCALKGLKLPSNF